MFGTQAEYARHANVSRAAVSKWLKAGKIKVGEDGKIDFDQADLDRADNQDLSKSQIQNSGSDSQKDLPVGSGDRGDSGAPDLTFTAARAARERHQAKLAELDLQERLGKVLNRKEVEDSMVAAGRAIRQGLDEIPTWSDELDAAARNGGATAVKAILKERVRDLETMLVEKLAVLGDDSD